MHSNKFTRLVQTATKIFLNSSYHAPIVLPAPSNGAVTPTIKLSHVRIVKYDDCAFRKVWKPYLYLVNRVFIYMTAINKQHINPWLNSSTIAPILKLASKGNIISLYEHPFVVVCNMRAIV